MSVSRIAGRSRRERPCLSWTYGFVSHQYPRLLEVETLDPMGWSWIFWTESTTLVCFSRSKTSTILLLPITKGDTTRASLEWLKVRALDHDSADPCTDSRRSGSIDVLTSDACESDIVLRPIPSRTRRGTSRLLTWTMTLQETCVPRETDVRPCPDRREVRRLLGSLHSSR